MKLITFEIQPDSIEYLWLSKSIRISCQIPIGCMELNEMTVGKLYSLQKGTYKITISEVGDADLQPKSE